MTPDSTASEEKGGRSYWGFVIWLVVGIMLYPLSYGPALLALEKKVVSRKDLRIYEPLVRVVAPTPLARPFGMYLHLWAPGFYRSDGSRFLIP